MKKLIEEVVENEKNKKTKKSNKIINNSNKKDILDD